MTRSMKLYPAGICAVLAAMGAPSSAHAALLTDIECGSAGDVSLLLDVHVPEGKGPFPVAILVHGGGWGSGDKRGADTPNSGADVTPWFAPLSESGFTWFSINYRLAPAHRWPACLDDTLTAISWVKAHAAEFKGDSGRIALIGHSAGGHLASMAAMHGGDDARVQAVVGCAAATDFEQDLSARGGVSLALQNLLGLEKEVTPAALALLRETSPIHHVRPGLPPFLLIHGEADKSVPYQQSLNLQDRLRTAGVPCDLIGLPGAPHRLTAWEAADPRWTDRMVSWLQAALNAAAEDSPVAQTLLAEPGAGAPSDNSSPGSVQASIPSESTRQSVGLETGVAKMRADSVQKATERASPAAQVSAPWVADNSDGTYRNPVLFADYSDPDAIRVGDDYWMTASSFSHVPGLPILHSRDLVNWRLVNHALPRLVPADHFSTPRAGSGVWAPAIRHHGGKFWIFYPDPDFGLYVITAEDPAGAWSKPVLLKAGKGLIDPCPLWDDDGSAWLVHGWAKSRAGISNLLTLHPMAPDGSRVLDEGETIIDANKMEGWRTLEGPKFYKRDGWYWIFAPAGGVAEGYQAVFRARDIRGPYEPRIVLEQGATPINGPHQGAWVDTPSGEHWFLHFQERQPYGRIVHLQPMRWRDDGWPVMGHDVDGDGNGEPFLVHTKPDLPAQPIAVPPTSDDFGGAALGLQWQWQANPQSGWASLEARPGFLRLAAVPLAEADSHWFAAHLLLQKFPAPAFEATAKLHFVPAANGDSAGLMVFGYDYAWLGLRQTPEGLRLVLATCSKAQNGGREVEVASVEAPGREIKLGLSVARGGICQFSWSADGVNFRPIGERFQATESRWVGAKVGLFASAVPGTKSKGHADFETFLIE